MINVLKFQTLYSILFLSLNFAVNAVVSHNTLWNGKQCRPDLTAPSGAV